MQSIRSALAMALALALLSVPARGFAQPAPLTLHDVERGVIAANPSLSAMRHGADAARARAAGAGAWADPELSVMAAPRSFGTRVPGDSYRVALTQRLAPFGSRSAQRLEAGARFDEASANVESARRDLLREARVAFAEYRRTTRSRLAHAATVDLAAELRQVALARYAAGLVEQQDPLAAGVESARLAHHAVLLDRERRVAVARLNALLGRPASAELPPPADDSVAPVAPTMAAMDTDSLVRAARTTRPEVQAAVSRVAARVAQRRLAQRSRWPGLMVGVAYDTYMDEPERRTSLELGVELPLFGGRSARRQEADAELAVAEAEHRALMLDVEREVVEALARDEEAEHDLEVLDQGVLPAAAQSVAAIRNSYEANRASFLALLDAMRSLAEAQMDRIDAVAQRDVARADLARALGDDGGMSAPKEMR